MEDEYKDDNVNLLAVLGALLVILATCIASVVLPAFALQKLLKLLALWIDFRRSVLLVTAAYLGFYYWPRIRDRLGLEYFQDRR